MSRTGAAKQIFYAWGKSRAEDLATATERTSGWSGKAVTVHVDTLAAALKDGSQKFMAAVAADPNRAARVDARAGKFFAPLSVDVVQAYLEATDSERKPSRASRRRRGCLNRQDTVRIAREGERASRRLALFLTMRETASNLRMRYPM